MTILRKDVIDPYWPLGSQSNMILILTPSSLFSFVVAFIILVLVGGVVLMPNVHTKFQFFLKLY
jgi:hypothetical protein